MIALLFLSFAAVQSEIVEVSEPFPPATLAAMQIYDSCVKSKALHLEISDAAPGDIVGSALVACSARRSAVEKAVSKEDRSVKLQDKIVAAIDRFVEEQARLAVLERRAVRKRH